MSGQNGGQSPEPWGPSSDPEHTVIRPAVPPRPNGAAPAGWPPQGPPPGSVGWLKQHYPAPGDPAPPPQPPQPPPAYGPPSYASPSAFAPESGADVTVPPPPGPKKSNRGMIALLIGGGAVLVALVVFLAFFLGGLGPGGATAKASPADGARQFLEAVAAGDSARALALQVDAPTERSLLTDEVLTESRQRAPISNIRVTLDTPTAVELTYQLGAREAKARFLPVRQPDGTFKVQRGTTTVQVSRPRQVPVLINDTHLSVNEVQAFPGAYRLSTGLANLEFADPEFTVSGPEAFPRLAPAAKLSQTGEAAFLAAAKDQLNECVKAKELNPPNCPQSVRLPDGVEAQPNSINWSVVGDPFVGATPKLNLNDESVAEVRVNVQMRITASTRDRDGRAGTINAPDLKPFSTLATGQVATDPVTVRFVNS